MPEFSVEFWIGAVIAVVTLVVGLGVTLAMDAKTRGEFAFAVTCFVVSASLVTYGIVEWQMSTAWSGWPRVFLVYALLAGTVTLTGEAIRWARGRHIRASTELKAVSPPPIVVTPAHPDEPGPSKPTEKASPNAVRNSN
jgi:hypothetical protein